MIEERLKIAIKALQDISDPIAALERNLKKGERLNGMAAVQLSNDPYYLRKIAEKALSKIECLYKDHGCPLDECNDLTNCVEFR